MKLINADIYREKLIDEQWNLEDVDGESHIRIDEVGHCINMLDRETIIEAIPIEWIEDYKETIMAEPWKDNVLEMIEQWRKENVRFIPVGCTDVSADMERMVAEHSMQGIA